MTDRARQIALRLGFVAVLLGGLLLWGELRKPRELPVEIDLTSALPGEITGLDVVVTRDDGLLARAQPAFDGRGAPGLYRMTLHARPGAAEVEVTLLYGKAPARRTRAEVDLTDSGARVVAR